MKCDCSLRPGLAQVRIQRLTNGPFAVARHQSQALFVAGVAPGDTVAVSITAKRRNFLYGRVVHLCHAGAAYRQPPCSFYDRCGGCPWQQVKEAVQRTAKVSNLHETFRRIGKIELAAETSLVPSPLNWAYRNRVRLHVDEQHQLGFKSLRSNEITPVAYCMVAEPTINAELRAARRLVERLSIDVEEVDLVAAGDGRVVLVASARGQPLAAADRDSVSSLLAQHPGVAGVVVKGAGRRQRFGQTDVAGGGAAGPQPAEVFSQANREANVLLVDAVLKAAALTGRESVLELFCGAGNFSIPLARRARVLAAFDRDAAAIAAARRNAAIAGVFNASFTVADACAALDGSVLGRTDAVILDPPRSGARDAIGAVARAAILRVVYVSCDLATAARDASVLVSAGYTIDSVTAVDLFPQTHHVEVVLAASKQPPKATSR